MRAHGDPEGQRRTTTREKNPWFLGFEAAILIVGTMIPGSKAVNRFPFCRLANAALLLLALAANAAAANQPCRSVYSCADQDIAGKNYDHAIAILKQHLARAPQDLKAINLLGAALTGAGRVQDANLEFERALRLDPHFYPALTNLAANEAHAQRVKEAKDHLKQALEYAPKDESANLLLGEIYYSEGQYALAVERYRIAGGILASGSQRILHYAECELRLKHLQQALGVLDRLTPSDGDSHFRAGALLVEDGDYADAAREFGLARGTYKDPYLAGYDQALAYLRADDAVSAIRAANELLNQGHGTSELANLAASAYLKNGQVKQAYNALRLATHLDPKNEDSYVDLCAICLDHQNYDLGLEIAEIGIANLPGSERLHLERGLLHAMKGQFGAAQEDFSKSAKISRNDVLPAVALGLVSMQTGKMGQAVEILRTAAREHPDSYLAQYWCGRSLLQSGVVPGTKEADEAKAAFEACIRLNPDFWHARLDLSKILLDSGALDSAIRELEKAVALDPTRASSLYMLSQACRRKGDEARARELALRASKLQSEDDDAFPNASLKRIVREGTSSMPVASSSGEALTKP